MIKHKNIVFLTIITLVVLSTYCYAIDSNITLEYAKENQLVLDNYPEIGCKAVYIAEPTSGKIIYEKNAHEKMYPASTTKILTALVVMENCDLNEKTTVSQHALDLVPDGYTNAKLLAGEELDIKTLLYCLLIPSANEAANVLAEYVGGDIDTFVKMCNDRANELGCEILHFTSPNGIHDENHYCSAYDLYLIAKECCKHDIFNEIVKTEKFTLPATNKYSNTDRELKSTNEMIRSDKKYYYENCTGIKTGHTSQAGECFVGSSLKDGLELISVVMGGREDNGKGMNERFYDTKQLMEFTYDNYSMIEIVNYGDVVETIEVEKATSDTASLDLIVDNTISTIVPNSINKEDIKTTITLDEGIVAPIEQNQVLGSISYDVDGLVYSTNLIASHAVEKQPYWLYNLVAIITILFMMVFLLKKNKKSKKKR
ncbi:MAG: D-alanyl-D-alanine carboxypeptidase [Clostridia bacterium]|nr:D-alanyl-D-alanine carboxypeptidase [Clostridia bacterium]